MPYLDDIIIESKFFSEMIYNLRTVLTRLRSANLKIKPSKCTLINKSVKILGHIVSQKGIEADQDKSDRITR